VIQRSSLGPTLGRDRMHFNVEVAVARYLRVAPDSTPTPHSTGG